MPADQNTSSPWIVIVVTAIITGGVTFGANYLLERIKTSKPQLLITESQSAPFDDGTERKSIYVARVENSGNGFVEELQVDIELTPWVAERQFVRTSRGLAPSTTSTTGGLHVKVNNLNPGEFLEATFLLSVKGGVSPPSEPVVVARGKGVIAQRAPSPLDTAPPSLFLSVLKVIPPLAASASVALAGITIVEQRRRARTRSVPDHDAKEDVFLSLASIHGASMEMEYYGTRSRSVSYWSESDRLASLVVQDPSGKQAVARRRILEDLWTTAEIAVESRAIIACNLAKLCLIVDKNETAAIGWITAARDLSATVVTSRTEKDPALIQFRAST